MPALFKPATESEEADAQLLATRRRVPSRRLAYYGSLAVVVLMTLLLAILGFQASPNETAGSMCTGSSSKQVAVYFGNGCFWERQWAYFNVEQYPPFSRPAEQATALVGYAGGTGRAGATVCYHCAGGCSSDYTELGHAEVVQVLLDTNKSEEQIRALAANFFSSFTGPDGARQRPDPMDIGAPYRSVIGLPGGASSPLFPQVQQANAHGMLLVASQSGHNPDHPNTVYVYDTAAFPFFRGERYHQYHSNFFWSEGMPYPSKYIHELWRTRCDFRPVDGCPEGSHH
uniref:peptide-methionine (S)-S-oxide reductase n=1 Tax=Calcidiscus leptoporus TaxID=127549 RepID=A0A7S0J2C6_9EUKA|mmetsp:Transcript_34457/g.80703  ORF Transcript_34457/g.80703 Transcript_34457/m.80703 type:complete len:286 (+) Transcript_34457:113-970(+)